MIAALLLMAPAPADFGVSPLLAPAHRHDWVLLEEDDKSISWWDRNSIATRDFGGTTYPVVLVRGALDQGAVLVDVLSAIDCAGDLVGAFDILTKGPGDAEPKRQTLPGPAFENSPEVESAGPQAMMRAVCGEDWTP